MFGVFCNVCQDSDPFCRAKEALAAKAKAEQELQALTLQLDTAVARAHECEEKQRLAEDSASKLKVSSLLFLLERCVDMFPHFRMQVAALEAAHKLADVERERDAARHR